MATTNPASVRILAVPVAAFVAGGTLVGAGVLAALEVLSAVGACVMCATILGLAVRA